MKNLFYLLRIFEISGRLISKMGGWIVILTAIAGALLWANVTFAGVLIADWPDAISCVWDGNTGFMVLAIEDGGGTKKYANTDASFNYWVTISDAGLVQDALFDGAYLCDMEPGTTTLSFFTQYDFGSSESPSSGATTTQSTIHNPTLDMWLGIVLFFFVFIFWVWFFRRPYDTY